MTASAARQNVERAIGNAATDLTLQLARGEVSAREMILMCRHILDLWIESGGSSLDDEVIGVLGIESQCTHVMLQPGQPRPPIPAYDDEEAEIESLGRFFRVYFTREMQELSERFGGN